MKFNRLIKSYELANAAGKIEKSLDILLQALKMQPKNISLLNKIAEINLAIKKYDEGLLYLNDIINDPLFENHKERLTDNYNYFMEKIKINEIN